MLGIFNLKHPNVYTGFTAYLDKKNGAELAGSLNTPKRNYQNCHEMAMI